MYLIKSKVKYSELFSEVKVTTIKTFKQSISKITF